jgi:hypothetical protein
MSLVPDFYTSSDEDAGRLVYHNQSECGYAQEIIRNGHVVIGRIRIADLCKRCEAIRNGK